MTYFDTFNQFLKLAFQSEMSKFKKKQIMLLVNEYHTRNVKYLFLKPYTFYDIIKPYTFYDIMA